MGRNSLNASLLELSERKETKLKVCADVLNIGVKCVECNANIETLITINNILF